MGQVAFYNKTFWVLSSEFSLWCALNVFMKGHHSTSADIPKNLTANVFSNHLLSVSESLTEPRTNVYDLGVLKSSTWFLQTKN